MRGTRVNPRITIQGTTVTCEDCYESWERETVEAARTARDSHLAQHFMVLHPSPNTTRL